MKFIVLLVIFGMNRLWVGTHPLLRERWMDEYRDWILGRDAVDAMLTNSKVIAMLGIPVVAALVFFWLVEDLLFGLVWILGSIAVVGHTVGVSCLGMRLQQHLQWLKTVRPGESLDEAREYDGTFKKEMIYEEFQSLYPQVFWFMVLGPAGALLYGLSRHYSAEAVATEVADADASPTEAPTADPSDVDLSLEEDQRLVILDLIRFLDWIPARISGLAFGIVGDFTRTVGIWIETIMDWATPARDLLADLAAASVADVEEEPEDQAQFILYSERQLFQLRDLLGRSLVCWLALIALLVLLGWR